MRKKVLMVIVLVIIALVVGGGIYKVIDIRKRAAELIVVPKRLAVYYGFLSEVKGDFNQFDVIVLSNGVQSTEDGDYAVAKSKIPGWVSSGKEVFGLIDMGVTTSNMTIDMAKSFVDKWKLMGVSGIFWDNCGYDVGVSRDRQKTLIDYVHSQGLKVMLKATEPDYIFSGLPTLTFVTGDYYLYDDWLVGDNQIKSLVSWGLKIDKLMKYSVATGVRIAAVSTYNDSSKYNAAWYAALMGNVYAFGYSYPGYSAKELGADTLTTISTLNGYGTQFIDPIIVHSSDYRTHTRRTNTGTITLTGDSYANLNVNFVSNTVMPTAAPTVIPTAIIPTTIPTVVPTTGAGANNLIANNSVENVSSNVNLPASWDTDNWGSNTTTFSYLNSGAHSGSRALKVQISAITEGDAKWTFNSMAVTAGATYKFSDWYQSNIGSRVVAYFVNSDWSENYVELPSAAASSVWTQYATTFTVPANAKTVSIFHLIDKVGWLITDDYSLSTGTATVIPTATPKPTTIPTVVPTATPTPTSMPMPTVKPSVIPTVTQTSNIIPNNSVETVSSNVNLPSSWSKDRWGNNTTVFTYLSTGAHGGSRALKVQISAINNGDAKWTFNSLSVTPGTVYKFSDWYQSNITSRYVAFYINNDGTENYVELPSAAASSNWKQYLTTFTVPAKASTLSVFHLIDKVGWLITDDYVLSK